MTAVELAQLKAELLMELKAEQERKERNRTAFRRAMEPFEADLGKFDWKDTKTSTRPDGSVYEIERSGAYGWAIRNSLGTLLRAIYKADQVGKLPAEKEPEMRKFVSQVLVLMKKYRKEWEEPLNETQNTAPEAAVPLYGVRYFDSGH